MLCFWYVDTVENFTFLTEFVCALTMCLPSLTEKLSLSNLQATAREARVAWASPRHLLPQVLVSPTRPSETG